MVISLENCILKFREIVDNQNNALAAENKKFILNEELTRYDLCHKPDIEYTQALTYVATLNMKHLLLDGDLTPQEIGCADGPLGLLAEYNTPLLGIWNGFEDLNKSLPKEFTCMLRDKRRIESMFEIRQFGNNDVYDIAKYLSQKYSFPINH